MTLLLILIILGVAAVVAYQITKKSPSTEVKVEKVQAPEKIEPVKVEEKPVVKKETVKKTVAKKQK